MITRDVEASAVADLALTPPRAALAATVDDEILLLPVSVTLEEPADPWVVAAHWCRCRRVTQIWPVAMSS